MLVALCVSSCGKPKPDTLVDSVYVEAEMEAAISLARDKVDDFIREMEMGNGDGWAVKAPIDDNGRVEHFWLTDISYADGNFKGIIGNDPGIVTNVTFGQEWIIAKGDISDWLFMRDGKMHGNYTMRPLLKTMPEAEAERFRQMLAEP